MNKDFIEIDFEGEGMTMVSTKVLDSILLCKIEKPAIVVKGKIGNRIQKPIKNLRND